MSPLLIPLAWVLLSLLLRRHAGGRRMALMLGAVATAAWLVTATELLGSFQAFTRPLVLTWWIVTDVTLIAVVARRRPDLRQWAANWVWPGWAVAGMAAVIGLLLGAAAVMAVVSPPNNFDSQTYHMPRQVRWAQQHSVAHFSSHSVHQLVMPPMAEYVGLHHMILGSSDRWANLVQWESAVMVMLAASLAAAHAGGGRAAQWLAALLIIANPMVFLMASAPKNDLVLAQWVSTLLLLAMRMARERRVAWADTVWAGLALGLALLTKGTAVAFAVPVSILIGVTVIRVRPRRAVPWAAAVALIAVALSITPWVRNVRTFGHAGGPPFIREGHVNQNHAPGSLTAVAVCNVAMHFPLPSASFTAAAEAATKQVMAALGAPADSPAWAANSFLGRPFFTAWLPEAEDRVGAPAAVVVAMLLPALAAAQWRRLRGRRPLWLQMAVGYTGFLLLSAMFRWQDTGGRLQIPAFCLLAAPAAVVLTIGVFRFTAAPVVVAAMLVNLWPSIDHNTRALWGPWSIFTNRREVVLCMHDAGEAKQLVAATSHVTRLNPRVVGFCYGRLEYRMQRSILSAYKWRNPPRFTSFNPPLAADRQEDGVVPEALVNRTIGGGPTSTPAGELRDARTGVRYVLAGWYHPYSVYVRTDLASKPGAIVPTPFSGWTVKSGLAPFEGPYPQWNLPVLAWGLGPRTVLTATAAEPGPHVLEVRIGRPDGHPCRVICTLNGQALFDHPLPQGSEFRRLTVPFTATRGANEIVFTYDYWDMADPKWPRAVVFTELSVRPARENETVPNTQPSR